MKCFGQFITRFGNIHPVALVQVRLDCTVELSLSAFVGVDAVKIDVFEMCKSHLPKFGRIAAFCCIPCSCLMNTDMLRTCTSTVLLLLSVYGCVYACMYACK